MTRNRALSSAVVVMVVLAPLADATASPNTAPRCSDQVYRQGHLAECNRNGGIGLGGGSGGGGGLLGVVGDVLKSVGLG